MKNDPEQFFQRLAEFLEIKPFSAGTIKIKAKTVLKFRIAKAAKAASKAKAKPEPTTEAEPEEEAPTVTKVEVIQVLQSVAAAHGREKIDKILGDFNVDKVSKLPESDYADLVEVAKALL